MSNRFQFRVPLKCKKCGRISWKTCEPNGIKYDLACNCCSGGYETEFYDKLPAQQCLGINDDNGQKLWERDIIRITPTGHMEHLADPFTALIKWADNGVGFCHTFLRGRPDKCFLDKYTRKYWRIEKLGNEATDPHLIKQLDCVNDDELEDENGKS